MIQLIEENLVRQNKAMILLKALLEEEFSRLSDRNPQGVSQIELSVQELLRQIAAERASLKRMVGSVVPGAARVKEMFETISNEKQEDFEGLLKLLDKTEQDCARQAAKNNEMAQALQKQSQSLLDFMHKQIQPQKRNVYSAKGRYVNSSDGGANILRGRL